MEMERAARRRDALFVLGQLSGCESGSLSDCLFPLGAFSVDDDFVGHLATTRVHKMEDGDVDNSTALLTCCYGVEIKTMNGI